MARLQQSFVSVPFSNSPADHRAIAALTNACYTNHIYTPEQVAASHTAYVDGGPYACFIAYVGEEPVGFAEGGADWLELTVHPQHLGKGIGQKLYQQIYAHLAAQKPAHIQVQIREDWTTLEAFYQRRGFAVESRWGQWKLDLAQFDSSRFRASALVEIKTLAQIERTADLETQIVDLYNRTRAELQRPPYTLTPEALQSEILGSYWFRPEAFWLVFGGGALVGLHWLAAYPEDPTAFAEWTCVHPQHRRKGIATALKVRGLEFAQGQGYTVAESNHAPHDQAILALNARLGFVRHPGYIILRKPMETP